MHKRNKTLLLFGSMLTVFSVLTLVFSTLKAQAAASITVKYQASATTLASGNTFTVAVNVTGSQAVQGVQLRMTYDATKVQYQSISYGSIFDYTDPNAGPGGSGAGAYFQMNQAKLGTAPTPPFTLATLTFKATATGSASAAFGYDAANSVAYGSDASSSPIASFTGATVNIDGTAPTVSITSPASNQTVSGTVSMTANAQDANGVSKVDFMVDGSTKLTDTSSPYSFSLDTKLYADGAHTLSVRAYDAVNNAATASLQVTIKNAASSSGGSTSSGGSSSSSGGSSSSSSSSSSTKTSTGSSSSTSSSNTSSTKSQPSSTASSGSGSQTTTQTQSGTASSDSNGGVQIVDSSGYKVKPAKQEASSSFSVAKVGKYAAGSSALLLVLGAAGFAAYRYVLIPRRDRAMLTAAAGTGMHTTVPVVGGLGGTTVQPTAGMPVSQIPGTQAQQPMSPSAPQPGMQQGGTSATVIRPTVITPTDQHSQQ